MTTKKKTARKTRRSVDRDRNWRRDLLARDLFTALCVQSKWPEGPGITLEQSREVLADQAIRSADAFERTRAKFKRSK